MNDVRITWKRTYTASMLQDDKTVPRELEICAETLQACAAASEGGADRIELCAALAEGGVTPSLGLLREALAVVRVPIHVLIRPRSGGFLYSSAEFRAMCHDVQDALAWGAAGVVIGMVTPERKIDQDRTAEVVRLAEARPVTFHRAFDHLGHLPESLELLVDLGCRRVLTSGGSPTVAEGRGSLYRLAEQGANRIRVAAGGGVTLENASRLVSIAGLDVHASLRRKPQSVPTGVTPVDPLWQEESGNLSAEAVRRLRAIVHGTNPATCM